MAEPTLVNIGTHSLALYTHGPCPTSPTDPVLLFIQGVACSSLGWAAVLKLLSPPLRSYTYDRSGCTRSEVSPLQPTAENIAKELSLLIQQAPITNPLILVGHSWAGIMIYEFLAQHTQHAIAGIVLVDANHETTLQILNVMDPVMGEVFDGIDPYDAKGLNAENKFTELEWRALRSDESTEKFQAAAAKEDSEYAPSFPNLRQKDLSRRQPMLGDKPVYVIQGRHARDWERMLQAAVLKGNGTKEQRAHVEEMIRTADQKETSLMHKHLKLSTKSKLVSVDDGHFVQLTNPEAVAHGVHWVLENIKVKL